MTSEEKAQQIGQTVTEYQATKVELGHVEQKLKRIASAYTAMGSALSSSQSGYHEYKIENGRITHRYPRLGDDQLGVNLVNEETLVGILTERESLQKKLSQLREQLRALGITNLE